MENLLKWFIIAMISTLILTAFVIGPFNDAMDIAVKTNARLTAQEIAGIINVLQSSPAITTNTYTLPKMDCNIKIDNNRVLVSIGHEGRDGRYEKEILQTNILIEEKEIKCKNEATVIKFVRNKGGISIL